MSTVALDAARAPARRGTFAGAAACSHQRGAVRRNMLSPVLRNEAARHGPRRNGLATVAHPGCGPALPFASNAVSRFAHSALARDPLGVAAPASAIGTIGAARHVAGSGHRSVRQSSAKASCPFSYDLGHMWPIRAPGRAGKGAQVRRLGPPFQGDPRHLVRIRRGSLTSRGRQGS